MRRAFGANASEQTIIFKRCFIQTSLFLKSSVITRTSWHRQILNSFSANMDLLHWRHSEVSVWVWYFPVFRGSVSSSGSCGKGYYFLAVESPVGLARLRSAQRKCLRAACVAAVCTLCGSLMDVARGLPPLPILQRRLLENSAGKDGHAAPVVCLRWSGGPVCTLHLIWVPV